MTSVNNCYSTIQQKLVTAFSASVVFAVLASPTMFKITGKKTKKYGFETSSVDGYPYASGTAIHTILFMLFTFIILLDNLLHAAIISSILIGLLILA